MKELEEITISMEEYKELLIIKGKYEELKSQREVFPITYNPSSLGGTFCGNNSAEPLPKEFYKITCSE